MNIGIICQPGLGDCIQSLRFLPCIDKQIIGPKQWTFFIQLLDINLDRTKIIEEMFSGLFHDSIDLTIVYYDPRDEKNIAEKASAMCDWVFSPMSESSILSPKWLYPSSIDEVKIVAQTSKNARKLINKDIFSNSNVFCHLYSATRGDKRNLSFDIRNRIGKSLIKSFGKFNVSIFAWDDDPDINHYEFNVIKNPEIMQIIESMNGQFYVGVDSWVHSLLCGESGWICWTEPNYKMNTQRISLKTHVLPGFRTIFSSDKQNDILSLVENISINNR